MTIVFLQSEIAVPFYIKELETIHQAIINVQKSLETICDSTDYTERLSTKSKFLIPASYIFQGCANGILQPDQRIFEARLSEPWICFKTGKKIVTGTYLRDYWELGKKFGT